MKHYRRLFATCAHCSPPISFNAVDFLIRFESPCILVYWMNHTKKKREFLQLVPLFFLELHCDLFQVYRFISYPLLYSLRSFLFVFRWFCLFDSNVPCLFVYVRQSHPILSIKPWRHLFRFECAGVDSIDAKSILAAAFIW